MNEETEARVPDSYGANTQSQPESLGISIEFLGGELCTRIPDNSPAIIPALRLIADSVAQQQVFAIHGFLRGSVFLHILSALLGAMICHALLRSQDVPMLLPMYTGAVMCILCGIKYYTSEYLDHAEQIGTKGWMFGPDKLNAVFVSFWQHRVVAVLVMEVDLNKGDKPEDSFSEYVYVRPEYKPATFIRAWTVEQKYRGNNMGRDLLDFSVSYAESHGWAPPVFAEDHANSLRLRPWSFAEEMDANEERARQTLLRSLGS